MYLHIGDNEILNYKEIIGIFDAKKMKKDMKEKSIVLVNNGNISKEYLSNISSITLAKRITNNKLI